MQPTVTIVLETYGEYQRPRHVQISFERAWQSVLAQTYPPERTTLLLTCTAAEALRLCSLESGGRGVRILPVPPGAGYYQKKSLGARSSVTDLVLLADGDCLYPDTWAAEMVAAFERGGASTAAVQGYTEFLPSRYSELLDPIYWGACWPEGPIRQIYAAHNLGFRREDVPRFSFEDAPLRLGLERALSAKIRDAGRIVWHNRRTRVLHEGPETQREVWNRAMDRGRSRTALWQRTPSRLERTLQRLGFVGLGLFVAALFLRDSLRHYRYLRQRGPEGPGLLRLPRQLLLLLGFHLYGGLGMQRARRSHGLASRASALRAAPGSGP